MDPISSIVGLVAIGTHLGIKVAGLVSEFRAAPSAIVDLSKELSALCKILNQLDRVLTQRFGSKLPFSPELTLDLQDVLNNCNTAFKELDTIMQKFEKREKGETFTTVLRRVQWMMIEGDIMKIRGSLERHKTTLNVTLLLVVKYAALLQPASLEVGGPLIAISDDTARIKELVEKISLQLNLGESSEGSSDAIKRYLNSVISEPAPADSPHGPGSFPTVAESSDAPSEELPPYAHINYNGDTRPLNNTESDHITPTPPDVSNEVNPHVGAQANNEATPVPSNSTERIDCSGAMDAEVPPDQPGNPSDNEDIPPRKEYGSDEGDGDTLAMAANKGDLEMVQLLLDFGTGVNARSSFYGTALQAAAAMGHGEVVKLLLDQGADPNIQAGHHNTALCAALICDANDVVQALLGEGADAKIGGPLQLAAEKGNDKATRYLLDAGADAKSEGVLQRAVRSGNKTVVQYLLNTGADVKSEGVLQIAVENGSDNMVQYLLDAGADTNATAGYHGTALQTAIVSGKASTVSLLLARGADPNIIGGFDRTSLRAAVRLKYDIMAQELLNARADAKSEGVLQLAAENGNDNSINYLLDAGADINVTAGYHGTALQTAAVSGKATTVSLLLARGADPNIIGGFDRTSLRAAVRLKYDIMAQELLNARADAKSEGVLQLAAENGNDNAINYLLDAGADINVTAGYHGTALQTAAVSGKATTVSLLLARGADPNIIGGFDKTALRAAVRLKYDIMAQELLNTRADPNSEGVLHLAAENGNDNAVNYLLDAGADINAISGYHATALQNAVVSGKPSTVSLLLTRGADPNIIGGFDKTTLRAAVCRHHDAIARELIEARADPKIEGALHLAAENGNDNAINYLLDAGADINTTAGYHGTALQTAAVSGKATTVSLLLARGADPNIIGGFDRTSLRAAVGRKYDIMAQELLKARADAKSEGVLHLAAENGNDNAINYLLDAGADINATAGYHGTALQTAAVSGKATTVSLLLAKGADPNIIGGLDKTALRAAVGRKHDAMAQELLKARADAKSEGVLHLAAENGNDNAIRYLLDAGAEINALAGYHGTALQTAAVFGRESTVRLLVEKGADPRVKGGLEGSAVNAATQKGDLGIMKILLKK